MVQIINQHTHNPGFHQFLNAKFAKLFFCNRETKTNIRLISDLIAMSLVIVLALNNWKKGIFCSFRLSSAPFSEDSTATDVV